MNTAENLREEYKSYVGRVEQFRPGEEPMDFEGFKETYKLWDREYERAWEANDHATIRHLERLMCV